MSKSVNLLETFDTDNLDAFEETMYNEYIKKMPKTEALQIIINTVEGDFSKLSDQLSEIAMLQDEEENN